MNMSDQILDVDLLAFETGSEATRRAVIARCGRARNFKSSLRVP